MTAPLLTLDAVGKTFGGVTAVHDVSLQVFPEQIFSVIGPNGAGKTTLFNLISGVLPVSSGAIAFEGRNLAKVRPWNYTTLGISRTFQNLALFKHGTVVENILVGLHRHLKTSVVEAVFHYGRCRREEIGIRSCEAPFSTASSATATGLGIISTEPPRFRAPTTIRPPSRASATRSSARSPTASRSGSSSAARSPRARSSSSSTRSSPA